MKKSILISLLFFPVFIFGQKQTLPIAVSLLNESTAIPFTRFFTVPIHPGVQIGTERNYNKKERSRVFQTLNLCYFYHDQLAQGVGVATEVGYEYRFKSQIAVEGLVGIGYMHTFATTKEYVFDNGEYVERTDYGNARIYPSISLDLGYYVVNSGRNDLKFFVRYQSWAEYPYSPDFIPVMTHVSLHVGALFFINKSENKND